MKHSSNPEDWFNINVPLEEERRFSHGESCKDYGERTGDYRGRLFVRRTSKGWEWYCHNCGVGGTKRYSTQNLSQILRDLGGTERLRNDERRVREGDAENFEWPQRSHWTPEGIGWLRKYGITDEEIDKYGIYETREYGGRIVLPIWGTYNLVQSENSLSNVGFQLRRVREEKGPSNVGGQRSVKYITYIKPGVQNARFRVVSSSDRVVLVEDILSAIKVGRVCSAYGMLGSPNRFPDVLALELEEKFERVTIWLDPDKLKVAEKWASRLSALYDLKTRVIVSDKDPKCYETSQIEEILT